MNEFASSVIGAMVGFIAACLMMFSMWTDTMNDYTKTGFFTRNNKLYHVSEVTLK